LFTRKHSCAIGVEGLTEIYCELALSLCGQMREEKEEGEVAQREAPG